MSTRTRAMALDGHSIEAEIVLDSATKEKVAVVILDILRSVIRATDDEVTAIYLSRVENLPAVPKVTPQRIRTARAALTRRGLVADSGREGRSTLGNPATVWTLTSMENAT